ncbi:DUF6518 family protein [Heliobacterium mobile]|uniref:DUF6518 family protein n=1 Tax=Heliobacterium mobile TaxID=28064 RepID=UPI001A9A7D6C|nr:DUF6518 family protein [Heliobacterium mobile]
MDLKITLQQKILRVIFIFLFGIVLGFLAKYLDNFPIVGEIGTHPGIWMLIATLIAVWSRSPIASALHVFVFFASMLIAYYAYSRVLFGFFPKYYFIAWGSIALISPICAYIAWYAKANGWIAAFSASLPISLLLLEGYSFFYTLSIPRGFEVFSAVGLFVILANEASQRLYIVLITGILFFVFEKLNVISLIFGGL